MQYNCLLDSKTRQMLNNLLPSYLHFPNTPLPAIYISRIPFTFQQLTFSPSPNAFQNTTTSVWLNTWQKSPQTKRQESPCQQLESSPRTKKLANKTKSHILQVCANPAKYAKQILFAISSKEKRTESNRFSKADKYWKDKQPTQKQEDKGQKAKTKSRKLAKKGQDSIESVSLFSFALESFASLAAILY